MFNRIFELNHNQQIKKKKKTTAINLITLCLYQLQKRSRLILV